MKSKLAILAKKLVKQFKKSASEMEVDELREEQKELFRYRDVLQDLPSRHLSDMDKARSLFKVDVMILEIGNQILKKEGRI